ncbi:ATPase, histidine kinase-, DNA gyrase B (macronuclear) [Tetrahymena thermophila SB210]|uniref:ATPase, histidine kinase-, DNA gyrase B n=1 Tax=Tetrahymena thermophila (strain SB210) TaxID=312017 RepID=I7M0L8_TETTS|nr:ATPase, histidine kinase-, DNA gyrase B [Tetrahymena thermophila SB210]EAR89361.3 ATPase, histidine kinase-, DNA gyrase B [Tetrahymena thermophila SB210]|eukprot:XP_001009606.3 ATPase, histidine kinase-, DNA gyrase B [Tetrahymena thermophila SB210]
MKVDFADQPTKRLKESDKSKKNYLSTYEFLKLNSDLVEHDQDGFKNNNYYASILKDCTFNQQQNKNQSIPQNIHTLQSPVQPSNNYTLNSPTEMPLKQQYSNENLGGDYICESNKNFFSKLLNVIEFENIDKQMLQPYWRNKFLLIFMLVSLIIANILKLLFNDDEFLDNLYLRVCIITLLSLFMLISFIMFHIKDCGDSPIQDLNRSKQQCCNQQVFLRKAMPQTIILSMSIFLFYCYSKSVQQNIINISRNNSWDSQINFQLETYMIEIILLYYYICSYFLSFISLKMLLLLGIQIINFVLILKNTTISFYYYFLIFIIQAIYYYESAVISTEFNSYSCSLNCYSKRQQFLSNTSIPTEIKINLKSPHIINSPNLIAQNEQSRKLLGGENQKFKKFEINKQNQQNQFQDEFAENDFCDSPQKFQLKPNQQNDNEYQQKNKQEYNIFYQYNTNLDQKINYEQNTENQQIQNPIKLNEIEFSKQSQSAHIQIPYQSQNFNDRQKNYQNSKETNNKKSNYIQSKQSYKKCLGQVDEQIQKEGKGQYGNEDLQSDGRIQQEISSINYCNSPLSRGDISSANELQKSSNSNNTSQQAANSMLTSESAIQSQIHRNFSIFKRLQDQSHIEEKVSQEDETIKHFFKKVNPNQQAFNRSNTICIPQYRYNQFQKYQKEKNKYKKRPFRYYSPQLQAESVQNTFNLSISLTVNSDDTNKLASNKNYNKSWKTMDEVFNLNQEIPQIQHEENKDQMKNIQLLKEDNYKNKAQDQAYGPQVNCSSSKIQAKKLYNSKKGKSSEYKTEQISRLTLPQLTFQRNQTTSYSYANKQKTKLYKNILKYLPEEGVILIDKNQNIHFANIYIQYLFPKSNSHSLFNELVQLKSIETLENYKHYLDEIISQKQQNQTETKMKNFNQNFNKVQLTNSINLQTIQDQQNYLQYNQLQAQNQTTQGVHPFQSQQKYQSKSSLKNINIGQSFSNQNINLNQKILRELSSNNNLQYQVNQNTQTFLQQQTSNNINQSSNHNLPIYSFGTHPNSSASIFPNNKLSQSNYFLKLDLFKDKEQHQHREKEMYYMKEKEQLQQADNIIRCKSFREQFEQIIQTFQTQASSYKQYGIINQNKFTSLFYRSQNQYKQESIEDVQIFEIQFIPCYLGFTEGVIVTIRDVTHFNQIKVLKDINERKQIMLRNVSHELRQPLNCIISMMQLTRDIYQDETLIQEYINPTLYSSQILLNLLNDFLDFSQIQAGTFKLTNVSFNIKKLFENIFQMMKAQIKIRQLNFILNIINQNEIPEEIKSDPNRIQQIITNLLGNAVKFTEQGDILLSLEKQSPYLYKVTVQDSGIGITEEGQKNLFKTFGKVDQEFKQNLNPQGVGLGLMISNILAKQLSPSENLGLQVESKLGHGTKFFFFILDQSSNEKEQLSPFNKLRKTNSFNQYNNLPSYRKLSLKIIENSDTNRNSTPVNCEENDFNSLEAIPVPYIMNSIKLTKFNQNFMSNNSIDSTQECNFDKLKTFTQGLTQQINENNIQKIDQKNQNNINYQNESQKSNQNFISCIKKASIQQDNNIDSPITHLDKEISKVKISKVKKIQNSSSFFTQGILLRQQTLFLQQDLLPSKQKQKVEDFVNSHKRQQASICQCSNVKEVLIVDDSDFNIYILDKYLKTFSIEADTSTNGPGSEKKVRDKIENEKCESCKVYKMIFMDLNLGTACGIQTANNIQQIYESLQLPQPVIIACTGFIDEATIQKCLANGFDDYLAKPIIKDQLIEILQNHLLNK